MNKRIAKTMLILCVVFLLSFYVLKFFFPELLLQTITHPTIIRLGEIMTTYPIVEYVFRLSSNYIVFYLFACAGSGRFRLKIWQYFILIGFVAIATIIIEFLPELYTHTAIVLMLASALICKGKLLYTTISFAIHGYLSQFLLSVRGFETVMINFNAISGFLMALETNVWLILLAIIFNIKEKKKYGTMGTTIH